MGNRLFARGVIADLVNCSSSARNSSEPRTCRKFFLVKHLAQLVCSCKTQRMAGTKRTAKEVRPQERGTPHDGLFHLAFSVPRHAASELQNLLPPELVARIKWDKLRRASDKYSDARLTARYADILFEVEIDDEAAFIYVLFEHKSEPEKWTLLQLLEYMVRIWRMYLREQADKPVHRLPIILPVVLHHGESGWTAPRRFLEYFGPVQEVLRPFIPDFGIFLDDVGKVSPDKLLARRLTPEAKLVLLCLLLGRTPKRFLAVLERRPGSLRGTWSGTEGPLVIGGLSVYIERVGGVPQEETIMAPQRILNLSPAEEIIFAREIRARRAEERGKLEEALALVSKLLTHRFGPLSTEVTTHLRAATLTELEEMGVRVLSAATLEEVLGKPKRRRRK